MLQGLVATAFTVNSITGSRARNILIHHKLLNYQEPLLLPGIGFTEKRAIIPEPSLSDPVASDAVKAYPNPTRDHITVEYQIQSISERLVLEIHTSKGQLVLSTIITDNKGMISLNLKSLKPGTYFISLKSPERTIGSCRFTIAR